MCVAWQISGKSFNDMKEEDVEDILAEKVLEATNKYLDEMAKQRIGPAMTRTSMKVSLRLPRVVPLTVAKVSEWNSPLQKLFNDMEESDPMLERSLKCKGLISTAFTPYAETLKDLRRQTIQTDKAVTISQVSSGGKMANTIYKSQEPNS